MSPSVTHQPELLLLQWMLHLLESLVEDILQHPLVLDPIPNQQHQTQGRRLLQFIPGSPGSQGHYRMDPTVRSPSQTSNFLTTAPLPSSHTSSPHNMV